MYRHSTAFFTNAVLAVTDSIFPHIKALECNAKLGAVGASFHITRLEKKNSATENRAPRKDEMSRSDVGTAFVGTTWRDVGTAWRDVPLRCWHCMYCGALCFRL